MDVDRPGARKVAQRTCLDRRAARGERIHLESPGRAGRDLVSGFPEGESNVGQRCPIDLPHDSAHTSPSTSHRRHGVIAGDDATSVSRRGIDGKKEIALQQPVIGQGHRDHAGGIVRQPCSGEDHLTGRESADAESPFAAGLHGNRGCVPDHIIPVHREGRPLGKHLGVGHHMSRPGGARLADPQAARIRLRAARCTHDGSRSGNGEQRPHGRRIADVELEQRRGQT